MGLVGIPGSIEVPESYTKAESYCPFRLQPPMVRITYNESSSAKLITLSTRLTLSPGCCNSEHSAYKWMQLSPRFFMADISDGDAILLVKSVEIYAPLSNVPCRLRLFRSGRSPCLFRFDRKRIWE
jgi:hypothetical protein